ncbi:hypothetical protein WN66_00007 [Saccharomyces cerevisiae]|uniref:Putative uncharacterized protein YAL066W n=1 Tax=Saccharomyces cerevisiae (strain ATCC 204508 / S288c) TaxID=559292 RepID=YAG6_YEAST|nr:RecName: Full=Putative uncharacterized protein YAL066W [Saccharomyces cerevisiae S288C]AAC04969.1 Yal066wp [Saccharomyces cerevisiae]AAS56495.1 YAL066W [Saccharomyces cerevisiae]KZV13398.1 hypothetical protein WN66_00007 [Saccharomyces cerevisiae]
MLSLVKRSILHSIPITRHILPIQLILVKMNHVQIRNIKLYHFISYGFMLTKLTVFLFNLFFYRLRILCRLTLLILSLPVQIYIKEIQTKMLEKHTASDTSCI